MNDAELKAAVDASMYHQIQKRGFAVPVDVLMEIGVLTKQKYEDWRFGKVPFLEAVCTINLSKLSLIMKEVRNYASKNELKPSPSVYKQWGLKTKGHRPVVRLRCSKTGKPEIEAAYATHYVDKARVAELKAAIQDMPVQETPTQETVLSDTAEE